MAILGKSKTRERMTLPPIQIDTLFAVHLASQSGCLRVNSQAHRQRLALISLFLCFLDPANSPGNTSRHEQNTLANPDPACWFDDFMG
jgi:hypothetical protein